MKERSYLKHLTKMAFEKSISKIDRQQIQRKMQSNLQVKKIKLKRPNFSYGLISEKIIKIKPFSVIHQTENVDNKIDEIFSLHKQSYSKRHVKSHINCQPKSQKSFLQESQRIILKLRNVNKKRKLEKDLNKLNLRRIKTQYNDNDDIQVQIANHFITQSRRQKKKLKQTMNNYQSFIQKAAHSYIKEGNFNYSTKNMELINGLKQIQERKNVIHKHQDQIDQYYNKSRFQNNYIMNKNDVWLWLRSLNKVFPTQPSLTSIKKQRGINLKFNKEIIKEQKRLLKSIPQKQAIVNSIAGRIKQKNIQRYYKTHFLSMKK